MINQLFLKLRSYQKATWRRILSWNEPFFIFVISFIQEKKCKLWERKIFLYCYFICFHINGQCVGRMFDYASHPVKKNLVYHWHSWWSIPEFNLVPLTTQKNLFFFFSKDMWIIFRMTIFASWKSTSFFQTTNVMLSPAWLVGSTFKGFKNPYFLQHWSECLFQYVCCLVLSLHWNVYQV